MRIVQGFHRLGMSKAIQSRACGSRTVFFGWRAGTVKPARIRTLAIGIIDIMTGATAMLKLNLHEPVTSKSTTGNEDLGDFRSIRRHASVRVPRS